MDLLSAERPRLPLWIPVCIGLGIALYFVQSMPTPLWPYLVAVCVAALCAWGTRSRELLFLLSMAALTLLLGAAAASFRLQQVEAPVLQEPVYFKMVEGTIEDIQPQEKKVRLILRDPVVETLEPAHTPARLSISLKAPAPVGGGLGRGHTCAKDKDCAANAPHLASPLMGEVRIGQRVRLPAMLFPPPSPAMPGAYDFARMFYFQKLGAVGFSPRQPSPSPVGGGPGWGQTCSASRECPPPNLPPNGGGMTALRLSISNHLVAIMGEESGAIASALMVGEQSRVSEEVADSMRASGIYHILSISGLHMTLATGIIFFTTRLLLTAIPYTALRWPTKKLAAIAGLLGGFAYLMLAGAPVPAVRSYIMVACVLGAVLVDRKGISMYSLSWAATLILLFMPESLFTASFQLTFAATMAIVSLYERWGHVLFHANAPLVKRCFLYFFGLILTSLAASLYTSPLAITHFNRMAIYGILANMLIVPLSSFWIMPLAMLALLAMPFGWDAPFLHLLKLGFEWMMAMSRFVAHFPYANIALPSPTHLGFVLVIIGGLWLALWASRLRYAGLALLVAGLATIAQFRPYDMIISDDAKRVAYRSESGRWAMLRGDVDSFEAEIWLRMQGAETMLSRKQALKTMPELACDKTTCHVERGATSAVVSIRKDAKADLCKSGADIVVSPGRLDCDDISHVIDRSFVEKHGAVALRFGQGMVEVDTTHQNRGQWPWTQGLNHDSDDD